MAKPTIHFNAPDLGIVAKRTTDRTYTHVVCVTELNADAYRAYVRMTIERDVANRTVSYRNQQRVVELGVGGQYPGYNFTITEDTLERAKKITSVSLQQHLNELHDQDMARAERHIAEFKPAVQAWCGRLDLAAKERDRCTRIEPWKTFTVRAI